MNCRHTILAVQFLGILCHLAARADETLENQFRMGAPLVREFCTECHSGGEPEGGVNLANAASHEDLLKSRKQWLAALRKLQNGEMPPADAPQPSAEQRKQLIAWLDQAVATIDCSGEINAGRPTLRRLNRVEYRHTIRDLLGVEYEPADDFPADDVGYGFDNIGDVLSLPPLLMEKYLTAAEEITNKAIVVPRTRLQSRIAGKDLNISRDSSRPLEDGSRIFTSNGEANHTIEIPRRGVYKIQIRAYGDQAGGEYVKMALRFESRTLETFEVLVTEDNAALFTHEAELPAGKFQIGAAFVNDYYVPAERGRSSQDRNLYLEYIDLSGPLGEEAQGGNELSESHRRIFIANPKSVAEHPAAAVKILRPLAERAFRRPVGSDEVLRLSALATRVAEREGFERGIQIALQAMLASPHFLFKVETPQQNSDGNYHLSDHELAVNLSYFLWNTMPDEELFRLASEGKLKQDDVLKKQVARMLADEKAKSLANNFAVQWLGLRDLEKMSPDPKVFPEFNDRLRADMQQETILFFDAIRRENRSVTDLLSADFTYLNAGLARHYGIEPPQGDGFQRVNLAYTVRRGLLSHGSVLTVTSTPARTSPVKRGKWVLDNLLGEPPPPPAPDVPMLESQEELTGTLRERTEQHRQDPRCATCHKKMDPLGFALENYNAIGQWRTKDAGQQIDARGELPDGATFNGPNELKDLLLTKRQAAFHRCLTEKMLTYALGRGLEYYDQCAVNEIVEKLHTDGRFSTMVEAIVLSRPFRQRGH